MNENLSLNEDLLQSELRRGSEVVPPPQLDPAAAVRLLRQRREQEQQSLSPPQLDPAAAVRQMRQERDAARLRQTAIETQGSNPELAARAQRLGRDMGLPPAVVERNLPEVERQAELQRLNGLSHDDYLANYLADPDNYRVARDDVNMLEEMSKAARQVGNVARAVPGGAVGGAGSAISGLGSGYDALTRNYVGRPIDAALGALGLGSIQDYNAPLPWWAVPTEILRRGGGAIKEIGRAIDPPRDEQNIATDIAGGVGQLGLQIATVILTGGQAAIPMLLAQGADQQAERLERQGKYGTPEGDAAIVAGAAVTALTEKYGLDFIMRKLPQAARDGIMRRLQDVAASAGAEAVQEVVEGILQNVVEYAYYNPDAEILQDFSREAIAAGGAAAVVRSVLLAASGGRASAQRRQDGQRAEQDSEALKRVNELAEQSKLRERNPDKFREFVRGLVEPDRAVEIDAETAVELFQSEPDLTQFMTRDEAERVGREVALAREVGSDVRMPLTTFIGAFVGHPQFDTLAENVRLSDNAPTAREASMSPEDLERQVGLLRDEVGTVARQQEATREIYDDIFAQLKAAAYDDLTATKYAAIYTARLRTRGERLGQDPLALHREKMLEIQRRETGPRGSIQFMPNGRTIIKLTEKADLSTFLHEMSHDWLEEMKADASLPDAPAQIVEDWNRIAAYLGIDPGVDVIPTEAHETFARTGEAYFMEGKAPSLELAPAFERFKAWMVRIYRTIVGLGVPINDEIRGVFDRMLAADDEIEAAKNQFQFNGLFALAKDAGMTEDEFRRYQGLSAKARLEAEQKVLAMLQAEERQAQREEYRDARETITAEVETEVKGRPVYQTIAMLARGEMPDGTTLDTPMKLDRALVRASYGTGIGKRLPRGVIADNGVPPDLVAPMFGFTSGDEMIKAMEAAPPLQQEIRRIVQERLKAQFPNPVDDGRAAEAAIEALHNDAQMQVLEAEFKALQRLGAGKLVDAAVRRSGGQGQQAGQAMGPEARAEAALGAQRRAAEGKASRERVKVTVDSLRADRKAIERAADAVIGESSVNDLMNTQKWRRAERASANAVIDAVAGQDWPAAAWHQRQRIINAHMVRRSMEARKDIEKAIGRFDKYLSKKPGPIDPDYLEKVRTILSAYQFGPQLSDRRRNLLELRAIIGWQKALSEDEQARLDIPPEITAADEKTHYRDMTVNEFMALRDTVENIATVGRTKNRLLREQAERDLNRTAKLVAEAILDNVKTVARRSREAVERGATYGMTKFKDQFFASHRKIESLVREFDGFKKLGPVWQALFKPLQDAQNTETRMSIEATEAIRKLFESYPADARRTWRTKTTYYPEIGQSLSKATVMSLALNWGNEGNREAIRKGYKWSDDQVRAVLNQTLTESDWQFVQGVWDYIDSFWPKLSALEKRVKGIEPVKVEASPVRTPFGELRGGYYPLKYDPDLSERAFTFQVDKMAESLMSGQVAKASTRTGAALERVGSGGMPVRLELDVMFEHVAEVIHDLSHREAILDVVRLLEHPEVKGAVLETKGPQFHRAMKDWVRDIAAGDVPALTWFDKVVQHLRGGMSIAAMGWKLTTALVQVTGFIQSAVMLPKGALLKSVAGFYGNPLAMSRKVDFVFERSVEMRTRSKNLDRDIRDTLRKLGPEGKTDAVKRSFFYLTGLMDMGVAMPTWLAAYETGMEQFQGDEAKAIDYADQVVRTTQSSGLQKDLASIQRGDPRMKMFTAFYSYFSATYNLMVEQGRGMKAARDMPKFVANMALLTIVPAVLSELLLGRGPDEDEEEPWWAWAGKVGLKFALSGFVGVRDVVNAMGSDFGYAGSPVGSAVESMVKLGKQIGQGEMDKGLARAAVDTAGPVLHLPSRQAWITAEGIYLWSEGHEITPFEMFVTRDPKKFR